MRIGAGFCSEMLLFIGDSVGFDVISAAGRDTDGVGGEGVGVGEGVMRGVGVGTFPSVST